MAVPGDIVRTPDGDRVVVDVAREDDAAYVVHRAADDLAGDDLAAHAEGDVEVIGHLPTVPGWVETAHGEWGQTP